MKNQILCLKYSWTKLTSENVKCQKKVLSAVFPRIVMIVTEINFQIITTFFYNWLDVLK